MRAEQGGAQAFGLMMQAQAMAVGQRRIKLSMQIAELDRRAATTNFHDGPPPRQTTFWGGFT